MRHIDWIEAEEAWLVSVTMCYADGIMYDASEYIYGHRDGIPEEKLAEVLAQINQAHKRRADYIND